MNRLVFSRACRLLTRPQYELCYQRGRRFFLPDFIVYVRKRLVSEQSRLGLTVSKKVGNAVQRNKVKRLVREVFRLHVSQLPFAVDMIFIPKRDATSFCFAEINRQWEFLVKKIQS